MDCIASLTAGSHKICPTLSFSKTSPFCLTSRHQFITWKERSGAFVTMAFGFAVGDFIAVGNLVWTLYRDCYAVARGAPQEFQQLLGEISTLSNSLKMLQEEVTNPDSILVRAGEDRVRMVNEMVSRINITLKELQKVAKKYKVLRDGSKRKRIWEKFKWSVEFTSIDSLRNKVF